MSDGTPLLLDDSLTEDELSEITREQRLTALSRCRVCGQDTRVPPARYCSGVTYREGSS
jgi:hypothetical protein